MPRRTLGIPAIGVPANWIQMSYCIVAALDKLGYKDAPYWDADIQSYIEDVFGDERHYVSWDLHSREGKAFHRAMAHLRGLGVVHFDDSSGYSLMKWTLHGQV